MVPRYCDDEPGAAAPSTRNCSTATSYDAAPGDVRTHCGSAAPPSRRPPNTIAPVVSLRQSEKTSGAPSWLWI